MDFNDTPQEAEFRTEARAWLDANAERLAPGEPSMGMLEREDEDVIKSSPASPGPWSTAAALRLPSRT